jgi:hypothetical protein
MRCLRAGDLERWADERQHGPSMQSGVHPVPSKLSSQPSQTLLGTRNRSLATLIAIRASNDTMVLDLRFQLQVRIFT